MAKCDTFSLLLEQIKTRLSEMMARNPLLTVRVLMILTFLKPMMKYSESYPLETIQLFLGAPMINF